MSADSQSTITLATHSITLSSALSHAELCTATDLLGLLPTDNNSDSESNSDIYNQHTVRIKAIVDGRGLACPMPLLKTKVALRAVAQGESLYVVATDPNSQADIVAFCHQSLRADAANSLLLVVNEVTSISSQGTVNVRTTTSFDTIYHFIITKTDSN